MQNADEIQKWFVDGGKYQYDFAVNDIISALSNNRIKTMIGHEDWGRNDSVEMEIFAYISTIDVLDNPAKDEAVIRKLIEAYKEIVK